MTDTERYPTDARAMAARAQDIANQWNAAMRHANRATLLPIAADFRAFFLHMAATIGLSEAFHVDRTGVTHRQLYCARSRRMRVAE